MSEQIGFSNPFTKETLEMSARLWARASISLIDVRYRLLHPDTPLQNYRMPSSMFVFAHGGPASVELDRTVYQSERFGIFHGGKGAELSLHPIGESLKVYMVLYKAEVPLFYQREVHRLLAQANPFVQTYGFSPENPVFFVEKFLSMYDRWNRKSALDPFYAKVVLYQIVFEIHCELEKGGIRYTQPDYVGLVKQYLERHYSESVSIQQLIEMLPLSRSQLMRLFKKRERRSFQEYLNGIRLRAAKRHLLDTNATIQEIAAGCGFVDELNLQRMFKKHVQMTPSEYRIKMKPNRDVFDIDNDSHYPYNEKELDRLVNSTGDGELTMFGKTRSKEMILAAAMSLMLLLAACTSATPANTGSPGSAPAQTQNQATPSSAAAQQSPSAQPTGESAAATRVYTAPDGKQLVIPVHAQRIVSIGLEDMLLSMDAPLVQASGTDGFYLYDELQEKRIPTVYHATALNYEAVLSAQPELIIADSGYAEEHGEKLALIAPTLFLELNEWQTSIVEIGKVLGREDKANQLIQDYDQKLSQARKVITETAGTDKTVAFVRPAEKQVQLRLPNDSYVRLLYRDLGLSPAPIAAELQEAAKDAWAAPLSMEKLPELVSDYLFFTAGGSVLSADDYEKALNTVAAVEQSTLWQAIPAVKQNRAHQVSARHWMLNGPIADSLKIDDVVAAITGKN